MLQLIWFPWLSIINGPEISFCLYFHEGPKIVSARRFKPSLQAEKNKAHEILKEEVEGANEDPGKAATQNSLSPKFSFFICGMSHTYKVNSAQQNGGFQGGLAMP